MVAWEQIALSPAPAAKAAAVVSMPRVEMAETPAAITVTGRGFTVAIGRASGALESFRAGHGRARRAPLVPNFWRVPLDNDIGFLLLNDMPKRMRRVEDGRAPAAA